MAHTLVTSTLSQLQRNFVSAYQPKFNNIPPKLVLTEERHDVNPGRWRERRVLSASSFELG